jgi:hypothetical protein
MYTQSALLPGAGLPPGAVCRLRPPRHLGLAQLNLYEPARIISMSDRTGHKMEGLCLCFVRLSYEAVARRPNGLRSSRDLV